MGSNGRRSLFAGCHIPVAWKSVLIPGLVLLGALAFLSCSFSGRTAMAKPPHVGNGVVASSHPLATEIGLKVLEGGGNAIDAAVAVGLALGVVDQFNSGLGGGGFLLIRLAGGRVIAIDGREKAPGNATRDMYIRNGEYIPSLSKESVLAVGVPGMLAAYAKALEVAGTRSLEELIRPSILLAREGFPLDENYVSRYRRAVDKLSRDPASADVYLHEDGSQLPLGEIFRQPDLAETYGRIAEEGPGYFYRGDFSRRLASYMKEKGGLITEEDMLRYRAVLREPVRGSYNGYEVYGMPPPSSGGVHIQQILNMLELSGALKGRSEWGVDTVFRTSRFMSRAFQDRAVYLGDGDYCPVPVKRLISREYAEKMMADVSEGSASQGAGKGNEEKGALPQVGGHTTNLAVVDSFLNAVAINQSVNLNFGAKITLPGTGVILNNEMDDFSARPGVPNAFGLVGSEANAIEPGKRPLSSMSPTIVVKGERPVLVLGGAGGPTIITAVLQTVVGVLDFGMPLAEAMRLPRFHHQYIPDLLMMEKDTPIVLQAAQKERGQKVMLRDRLGVVNAIAWSEGEKAYKGLPDPRIRGRIATR